MWRSRFAGLTVVASVIAFLSFGSSAWAATASWSLEPSSWDFGTVVPGSGPTTPKSFILTNTGETTLTPIFLSLSQEGGAGFELAGNTCHVALAASGSCTIKARFEPTLPGLQTAELSMQEAHAEVPPAVGMLSGTGVGAAAELSPSTLSFGSVQIGSSPPPVRTVLLTNRGQLDLSISSVSVKTNSFAEGDTREQFRLGEGSCAAAVVVPPGESCSVDMEFTPTEPFGGDGYLVITDNAPDSPQRVPLVGAGTIARALLVPHIPGLVHYGSWVRALSWGYVGTRGPRVLLARVDVRPCTRGSFPVIRRQVQERKTNAVVTLLGHFPAEDRLEGSGCQRQRIRRVVRVRLKRPVDELALYDGSQTPFARRGPIG